MQLLTVQELLSSHFWIQVEILERKKGCNEVKLELP